MEQTYNSIQYIFVNDCTPDNSEDIILNTIKEYPEREKDVLLLAHEKNRGLAAARNTAVDNATGQFIFHVDSDDYIEKDAIEKLVKTQIETDADIVTGLSLMETNDVKKIMETREYATKDGNILDVISPSLRHTIWGRLIKKTLYTDNNIQVKEGSNVGEDVQVVPKLFYYANKTAFCYSLVYHYNCENVNSYMHQITNFTKLCKKGEQDVDSYMILRDFFKGKDSKYFIESEMCVSKYTQKLMWIYVKLKDKNNFERIKNIYNKLGNKKVFASVWCHLHNITGYNYWFCRLTDIILSPLIIYLRKRNKNI
jgi:glycosyltransferase involved in cell wall biosynthesis